MYLKYLDEKSFFISEDNFSGNSIEIDKEIFERLNSEIYEIIKKSKDPINNMNFDLYFKKVDIKVNKINNVKPVEVLAKQVGLLTLENKKKDVQIESLMKAVKALTNK